MAVLSSLRALARGVQSPQIKQAWPLLRQGTNTTTVSIRMMGGHGNKMVIVPTRFEYTEFKDHLAFFLTLGLLPMAILIGGVNLFVGPAKLADIPDNYDPKHWEYHSHPISRWFSQYVYTNPQKDYEKMLHMLNQEQEKVRLRKLEKKVKMLMAERGDYKGWYYMPVNDRQVYLSREVEKVRNERYGAGPAP